jgi:hypothetical protein
MSMMKRPTCSFLASRPRPFLEKFMSLEKSFTHRNQESSDFGESIGDAGVSFCGRCECLYLDVKIL